MIETANAFFVKGLPQDLLGGKSVNRENIRVILDSDHDICGMYPLDKNHEQPYQESIEFTSSGDTVIGGRERAMHIDLRKHFAHETIQNRMMRRIRCAGSKSTPPSNQRTSSPSHWRTRNLLAVSAEFLGIPTPCVRHRCALCRPDSPQGIANPEGGFTQIAFCRLND
jgi:hypothetical protein